MPILLLLIALTPACGKEGPPLPPLRREPGHIREVSAARDGDRIELRLQIPAANFDGSTPPVMERVEIYMLPGAAGAKPPGATDLLNSKNLAGVIPVRPPADPADETAPAAPEKAKKLPGVVAGQTAVYVDVVDRSAAGAIDVATRYYLVVGATGRSRRGRPSPILAVPLSAAPAAPGEVARKYDQKTMTLSWPAEAGHVYRVYEASGPGAGAKATELTTEPLKAAEYALPVWFATTRCFAVRAIAISGNVSVAGPIGPGVCETPVDSFAPPAPAGLSVFQTERGIELRWNASDAPDLAGYNVLRGEGAGETLQPLLKTPTAETTHVDTAITAGVTYVYVVIAMDQAGNPSGQSNRQQITARLPASGPGPTAR